MKQILSKLQIDALSLGAIVAVLPLVADLVWLYHDWTTNEFALAFVYILISFVCSIILGVVAFIWYHRSTNKAHHLEERIRKLEQFIR